MKNPPAHLVKILWEYDISTLDTTDHIVLSRILSYGDMVDIRYVGLDILCAYYTTYLPQIDTRSKNFWTQIFDLPYTPSPRMYDMINAPKSLRNFG
jgi:hypothetical protein